jgi:cysteine synthase
MASVLDFIGETPLVEITQFDCGPCRLFLKLESANPSGSIKDRPARFMIEAAENDGRLKPGGTIVEATAGNTGLGLALVGGRKGYRIVLVVPDKMAREKILQCKAMGAEVVLTRSDVGRGHPDYYQDLAEAITARTPGAVYINQFSNPANPQAHETTTGPEIFRQMQGHIDAVVVGVGSGGTLTGVGRFLAKHSPKSRMILADPVGTVIGHKPNLPRPIGRRDDVRENHLHPTTGSHAAQLPYPLSLVAMSRHSGLAQLKRRCAQDCAVHSSDVRLAGASVERRQADDNSDRQNAPHSQNLTCIPGTYQLHKID